MPKSNQFGGNKSRKNSKKNFLPTKSSNFPLPDNCSTFICKTIKINGNYINVIDPNNKPLVARIPGSFFNRVWIKIDDYVLIQVVQELTTNKCHVLYKYNSDELKGLVKDPEKSDMFSNENDQDSFVFEDI